MYTFASASVWKAALGKSGGKVGMRSSLPLHRGCSQTQVPSLALFGVLVPRASAAVMLLTWQRFLNSGHSTLEWSVLWDGRQCGLSPLGKYGASVQPWPLGCCPVPSRSEEHFLWKVSLPSSVCGDDRVCISDYHSGQSAIAGEEHPKGPVLQEVHLRFLLTGLLSGLPSPQFAIRMCPPLTTKNIKVYQPLLAVGEL